MSREHGGTGHTHEPHGGARGLGWDLLDSIMLGCAVVIGWLLAEQFWRARQARKEGVRFDLTDKGRAAADAPAMTEPGCTHPECKLEHPHAGPAILRDAE